MAFSDVFNQGNKLGMFTYGQPQTAGPVNIEGIPGFSSLSKEDQNRLRTRAIESQFETLQNQQLLAPFMQPYKLEEVEGLREREARRAQELGKESLREAFKYSTLANIPKTIAQGFGNIAATNLYAGQAVADTFSKTLANYPRAQFASYQFQPEKYFG